MSTDFFMSSSYRDALTAISARTGAPLPSLIVSFAVLHELTAIAPLVGIFYVAKSLDIGERVVGQFARQSTGWATDSFSKWVDEGEKWAHRVGRRYGVFGFEKGTPDSPHLSGKLAGDVANAVLAYAATKALLPVRIGLSLYLTPAFSRGVVEPIRRRICRPLTARNRNNQNFWQVIHSDTAMMISLAAPVVAEGVDDRQSNSQTLAPLIF